jgi:AcrR family transcriptional regulator
MEAPRRRADARRNADRLVRAAIAAFEESGPGVALEEIARRADVGIATLYRLFGGRDALVRAAFEAFFVEEVVPYAPAARAAPDPGPALAAAVAAGVESLVAHRVLLDAAREAGAIRVDVVGQYLRPLAEVLAAAQRAGQVRDDVGVRDLGFVVVMALAAVHPGDPSGADRRRYLALLLAGLRPSDERLPPGADPCAAQGRPRG